MKRRELCETINDGIAPSWSCPSCSKGDLVVECLQKSEILKSKEEHDHPDWEPSWVQYAFSGWLRCSHPKCLEAVYVVGDGGVDEISGFDENNGELYESYVDRLKPKFFQPSLNFFDIPIGCPKPISDRLRAAFALFFSSPGATLNETRNAVELILDDLEIPREINGRRCSLHARIKQLDAPHDIYQDQLLAIKWLGNAGSHAEAVEATDALDALEITEHLINQKYSGSKERIENLVRSINERNGPGR